MVGMFFFGGRITRETEEIRNNDATPDRYTLNNFNDLPSAFVTLFELMVVNNWFINVELYMSITNYNQWL